MKEELITFKTAKLAKEVGFHQYENVNFFTKEGKEIIDYYKKNYNKASIHIARPTQSLLQRWLREKHGIDVWASPYWITSIGKTTKGYEVNIIAKKGNESQNNVGFITYEEALEAGLLQTLKLIKK